MKRSEGALIRLVPIGALRNGSVLYMPEPEALQIVYAAADLDRTPEADVEYVEGVFALFVADQQRVHDAILTGNCAPFEPKELPTFAQILRWS